MNQEQAEKLITMLIKNIEDFDIHIRIINLTNDDETACYCCFGAKPDHLFDDKDNQEENAKILLEHGYFIKTEGIDCILKLLIKFVMHIWRAYADMEKTNNKETNKEIFKTIVEYMQKCE